MDKAGKDGRRRVKKERVRKRGKKFERREGLRKHTHTAQSVQTDLGTWEEKKKKSLQHEVFPGGHPSKY